MPSPHRNITGELRFDVLDIVSDMLQWKLPADRWPRFETLANQLHLAVRSGDAAEAEKLVTELELAAPLRIQPIGGPPTEPAPDRLRHIARDIVHEFEDTPEPPASDEDHGAGR